MPFFQQKRLYAFVLALGALTTLQARQQPPGIFDAQCDVGQIPLRGSTVYNPDDQSYLMAGSGDNIWFGHDEFHFAWKKMKGDFILRTQLAFIGKGVVEHRKGGWMVRSSLDTNSACAAAVVHGSGLISLQYRRATGVNMEEKQFTMNGADVVQFERKGNRYIMSAAKYGQPFVTREVDSIDLGDDVYVGLFVCSHTNEVLEKLRFHNVRMIVPAPAGFVPYRDYIGSQLEIMDIASGQRTIVYESPRSLQVPNWTKDGKTLIYNMDGRLYKFDLATGKPVLFPTGEVTHNNNDHLLSFDGSMIGISGEPDGGKEGSLVYTLPLSGGRPFRVTAAGPSYLHGWSPDGKYLLYTGQRNGDFDIYKIPVKGGKEIQLTHAPGLDDGSEYSPDGKYIYFNSVRSGTMQIWRMKPDGGDPEQLTDDAYNNWFPHVSPDGKWIQYLSFPGDIDPSDHPFYQHIYLRLMPAGGGPSKVIAYVYGGQGSINTPTWSPDSQKIAFISNTQLLFPVYRNGETKAR